MRLVDGFVKIEGSSDLEDSSMAAGLCALFKYPIQVNLALYLKQPYHEWHSMYQRCDNSKYLFSRDQTIPLVAGLYTKGMTDFVGLERVDGKDIFSPSDRGHIRRCQGLKAYWYQDLYFWAELAFSAKVKPMEELNQLMAKLMVADKKFIKWYCKANPRWAESLRQYWWQGAGAWRNEKDFCEHMILKIQERISQ